MADETPRSSTRVKKSFFKGSISRYPESPLGATPRPDLRQQYPDPPPSVQLKSVVSHREEFASGSSVTDHKDKNNFTHLRKKTLDYTQVNEWNVDHNELKPEGSTRKAFLVLAFTFLAALVALGVVYSRSSQA